MMKKILFWFILVAIIVVTVEFSAHILYRAAKGVWVWEVPKQHDIFNIREFTELVEDDRLVTNKKNYACFVSRNRVYMNVPRKDAKNVWQVETDPNGFRSGINKYYTDKDNIVFIGDSVPFGWGVNGNKSVPSQLYSIIETNPSATDYGVINAAIPSYSLYQAINRYKQEIHGKYPVKYVILQALDPAPQFVMWGKKWNKQICWASKDALVASENIVKKHARKPTIPETIINKYSSISHVLYCIKQRLKKDTEITTLLDINDRSAFL